MLNSNEYKKTVKGSLIDLWHEANNKLKDPNTSNLDTVYYLMDNIDNIISDMGR